jgi:hypothetical protein
MEMHAATVMAWLFSLRVEVEEASLASTSLSISEADLLSLSLSLSKFFHGAIIGSFFYKTIK